MNQEIFANTVRVIGNNGEQLGVFTIEKALGVAEEASLDLVEISPNAEPPVCKVMDFGKYQYEQKKQLSDAKKKQKKTTVKMIKYRPSTEEGDYQIKFRNLTKFLDNGDKVKVVIWFRGREMQHRELGMEMLDFSSSKPNNNFNFVAIIKKLSQVSKFNLIITFFSTWTILNHFDSCFLLLFLCITELFFLFILIFTKVHDFTNRRFSIW